MGIQKKTKQVVFSPKQHKAYKYLVDNTTTELFFGGSAYSEKTWLGVTWILTQCVQYQEVTYGIARKEIKKAKESIVRTFNGKKGPSEAGGDFSFILYPLPKIALCYIFYEADEDFPASVRCLYSNNANQFMPVSGLADVGEYTSKQILKLIDH